MITVRRILEHRGRDAWGSGDFKAPRGSREHKGIDYVSVPGDAVYSPVDGTITKNGYPYAPKPDDKITYRYCEITDLNGAKHRVFYVEPSRPVGDVVDTNTVIGIAQDIAGKYSKPGKLMTNHIHYEIIDSDGNLINPEG